MNPQTHSEEELTIVPDAGVESGVAETEVLAQSGFTPDEIMSVLWLRQWYETGGSDRIEIVRRLEFIKRLVLSGKLEP